MKPRVRGNNAAPAPGAWRVRGNNAAPAAGAWRVRGNRRRSGRGRLADFYFNCTSKLAWQWTSGLNSTDSSLSSLLM